MSKKNKAPEGENKFNEFYGAIYGERWDSLKASLLLEKDTLVTIPGLVSPYYLDEASLLTASLLPVQEGSNVLDMCAAPGGKTLVLAMQLKGKGSLTSNDRSPDRRVRLKRVLEESLPEEYSSITKVTGFNAESWGVYEKDVYDYILLDAPCSSERHVIQDKKYLDQWSPTRPKRLSISQYAMLSSALLAAKEGAYILYSTCSINPGENDKVIARLFERHPDEVEEIDTTIQNSEKLTYGRIVLPDTANGQGPMYACLLRKKIK